MSGIEGSGEEAEQTAHEAYQPDKHYLYGFRPTGFRMSQRGYQSFEEGPFQGKVCHDYFRTPDPNNPKFVQGLLVWIEEIAGFLAEHEGLLNSVVLFFFIHDGFLQLLNLGLLLLQSHLSLIDGPLCGSLEGPGDDGAERDPGAQATARGAIARDETAHFANLIQVISFLLSLPHNLYSEVEEANKR